MSFNASLLTGLAGLVPTIPSPQNENGDKPKKLDTSNDAVFKALSPRSPASPQKNDNDAHVLTSEKVWRSPTNLQQEILKTTKSALASHLQDCRLGVQASASQKPSAIVLQYELAGIGDQLTAIDTVACTLKEAADRLRDFYQVTDEKLGCIWWQGKLVSLGKNTPTKH